MLKSTYKPSAAALAAATPLPPGWTEHKAPTGHSYYYNAETKQSTYKRPGLPVAEPAPAPPPAPAPHAHVPNLADPRVANAYLAQLNQGAQPPPRREPVAGAGFQFQARPRPQPVDKPRRKEAIPGCEPWVLVYTKYSRRFVYNPDKKASYWRIPEKLMPAILELDKARVRGKPSGPDDEPSAEPSRGPARQADDGDSSEYEEVEVTDDEADDGAPPGSKRQRTAGAGDDGQDAEETLAHEFTEADIAAQLQLMGDDYDDDDDVEEQVEGGDVALPHEDAKWLFKDLLNDFNINPYSPWEKLLEEGKIVDDARYTALGTTRARKACWDEWSRHKIAEVKEQRARQEKTDPKVGYLAFLHQKATPKLYWPEFKRKYKKEDAMRDTRLSDREREKAYREHMGRLKLPQATLKADLTALLRAQPPHRLHARTPLAGLPTAVLTDVRYISLEPATRDALVDAYVQSLPPPPPAEDAERDDELARERDARARRERALSERNHAVDEQRRRRERDVAASKARLRQGEREVEMAMRVDGRALQRQLAREADGDESAPR